MQIEIAEPGRMSQSGSSLMDLIQNKHMPALDLFVRETIQNSLDARISGKDYVEVHYLSGQFVKEDLSKQFEGITDALNSHFPAKQYKFLAVRDKNTAGLTGPVCYEDVIGTSYGNLMKLVYEICKPQENEGAGGSWGLGKTVYFRMGIGLVIYYSKILNEKGQYESRLAASFVEDERKIDPVIPAYKGSIRRGIAWWGESYDINSTKPVTDEKYIANFLKLFEIDPYAGNETGTTIIIPFINDDALISSNQARFEDSSGKEFIPFWRSNIEKYLKIAVQRWYAIRLNNINYPHGPFLRVFINNTPVRTTDMEPFFQIVQALYNRVNNVLDANDIIGINSLEFKKNDISVKKFLEDTKTGTLASISVSRDILGMGNPDNKPAPYFYLNNEKYFGHISCVNPPIVCYTRRPGMIVSYELDGSPWTNGVQPSDDSNYLIGLFVLHTGNIFRRDVGKLSASGEGYKLEEYVRRSEKADHTSWNDWSENSFNPRIITKIQDQVAKKLSKEYVPRIGNVEPQLDISLGKYMGDMLLPPAGFGTQNTSVNADEKQKGDSPKTGRKRSRRKFVVDFESTTYDENGICIKLNIDSASHNFKKAVFSMAVGTSEAQSIDLETWANELRLGTPFEIMNVVDQGANNLNITKLFTSKGICYGAEITLPHTDPLKTSIAVTVKVNRKDIQPIFKTLEMEVE